MRWNQSNKLKILILLSKITAQNDIANPVINELIKHAVIKTEGDT